MGNAFSFYQYEGTGVDGVILPTSSPHYTDFTGFYVPPSVIEGRKVGFLWRLFDDYESHAPTYRVRLSGQAGNRFNEAFGLSIIMSGGLNTVVTDDGSLGINFTGADVSGWNEVGLFESRFTGHLETGYRDEPTFQHTFTGQVVTDNQDIPSFIASFSGQMPQVHNDIPDYSIAFSGGFTKKDKDTMSFEYSLTGAAYRIGGKRLDDNGADTMAVTFELAKVIFEVR